MTYVESFFIAMGLALSGWNLRDAIVDFRYTTHLTAIGPIMEKSDVQLIALGWVVRETSHVAVFLTLGSFLFRHGVGDVSSVCVSSLIFLNSAFNRLIRLQLLRGWEARVEAAEATATPPPDAPVA